MPDAVAHVVTTTEQQLGPVDLLVNNAGFHVPASLGYNWEVDPEAGGTPLKSTCGCFPVCAGCVARHDPAQTGPDRQYLQPRRVQAAATVGCPLYLESGADAVDALPGAGHAGAWDRGVRVRSGAGPHLWLRVPFTAPEVPQELADIFRGRFSRGEDTPIDRAVQMLLFLVSGRADALSGRFILVEDKAEELVRRAEEIQREDLHILTLRT